MMSKMMSKLMSEFREKIAVDLADLRRCHVGAIRSIDVVCDTAASGMSHHRLTDTRTIARQVFRSSVKAIGDHK